MIDEIALYDIPEHGGEEKGIHPRFDLQVNIGQLSRPGAARVDDHKGALGIFRQLPQHISGPLNPMGLPGIGADDHHVVRGFNIFAHMAGLSDEQFTVDPEIAGFFLRQATIEIGRAKGGAQRTAIHAAHVIALAAATVIGKDVVAVGFAQGNELLGHLADRGVPVDRLIGAIWPASQRLREPLLMMLIVFQPGRLLAQVALGNRVVLIAAYLVDVSVVDLDFQTAIQTANHTSRLVPSRCRAVLRHRVSPAGEEGRGIGLHVRNSPVERK